MERDWAAFTSTPSRLTAEPMIREDRDRFLQLVAQQGYVDQYTGIRVSATGRRFYIRNTTVWNLIDAEGIYRGQAAAFAAYDDVVEKGS
ncbi:MEKHLA domain protein [Paenibacillus curdlanolyticus YK9]|uniref:MEKHLA domain protein n=1 Tax=Paenibacillus curdlanolyticus YK9 TaxID=717606 RepID=E0I9X7_9BACL|nr:MEKHLA domain-containing protein [Paenibacillus curdlanolyticus]EFM10554.1 MEKHLA domain protein [Paenibacillus curdlanolyticus YK9]